METLLMSKESNDDINKMLGAIKRIASKKIDHAFIICDNDSTEEVFIGSQEDAEKRRDELKVLYETNNPEQKGIISYPHYWHLHRVKLSIKTEGVVP
jgi:hypothetical protein